VAFWRWAFATVRPSVSMPFLALSSHTVSDVISEIGRRFAIAAAAITAYDVRGALLETQAGGTCIAASAALAAIVASSLSRAISSTIAVV
jgi:hypothetical protein